MPKIALADTLLEWKKLLTNAAPYAEMKDLKNELAPLQTAYERLSQLDAERAELEARRQRTAQLMGEVKEEGKYAAIQVREVLRGILGPRSELLVQFGISPRRGGRRPRKARPASAKVPPAE